MAHFKPKIVVDGVSLGIDLSTGVHEGQNNIQPTRSLMVKESLRKYSARCHY